MPSPSLTRRTALARSPHRFFLGCRQRRLRQIDENAALLASLPGRLVLDHLAQVPQPGGLDSALGLLDRGRTWELSDAYVSGKQGPPEYADAGAAAAACIKAAPERMVWGSDWPHPSEKERKPDDARLFDHLAEWAGGDAAFKRILVDNPELYSFPPVAS